MKTFANLTILDKVYLIYKGSTQLNKSINIKEIKLGNIGEVSLRVGNEVFEVFKQDLDTSVAELPNRYTLLLNRKDVIELIKNNIEIAINECRNNIDKEQIKINNYTNDLLSYLTIKELENNL